MDNIGFKLPDLIIESVLREGFQILRKNPQHIDSIMASLKQPYNEKKYGQTEINKIKDYFTNKEISIVHSFADVSAKVPCISIQLTADVEMENRTGLSDIAGQLEEGLDDDSLSGLPPITRESLTIIDTIVVTSYDSVTGAISVSPATDLSEAQAGLQFRDASGNNTLIEAVDELNSKIYVVEGSDIDVSNFCQVVSALETRRFEKKFTREKQSLIVGVHSKNRLMAIYIYIIVKYILHAKKKDIHSRGLELPTFAGSDFTRNLEHMADIVHTRFLTVTGQLQETWVDILGPLEDSEIVNVGVKVDKDVADNEELDRLDQTIQVTDE